MWKKVKLYKDIFYINSKVVFKRNINTYLYYDFKRNFYTIEEINLLKFNFHSKNEDKLTTKYNILDIDSNILNINIKEYNTRLWINNKYDTIPVSFNLEK